MVAMRYRGHTADPNLAFGIHLTKILDKVKIISHELITVVWPGSGVGIVQPQMDDHYVSRKIQCVAVRLLLRVRTVCPAQERGPGVSEITDIIFLAKQCLKP